MINWKSKNIEEDLSLYVLVSPLLIDQLGKVSESKKANPREKDLPYREDDITVF
jgi:hypothetical protein